jgi:hypothetical protein
MYKTALLISLVFFIAQIATLTDYGINWDTINHLPRGQTYLHYFLTGKKDFSDLPPYQKYFQDPSQLSPSSDAGSRSYYQLDATPFEYYMQTDGDGHPPLSDIIASAFNRVIFGKLGLINDVDSYRVYGVLLAAATVGLIFFWAAKSKDLVAGFIAAASLALYPLFWSETHFNTEKDIPETAFWSFFIFAFIKTINQKSYKWLIATSLLFGLALGTKFNIFFAIFIIAPWFAYKFLSDPRQFKIKFLLSLSLIPIIGFIIFFVSWPYLWQDPIYGLERVFSFYKTIGTATTEANNYYALKWIFYTTPPIILVLSIIGLLNRPPLIFILWLIVPIARVTMPGSSIYGGVRQLMEFIPALAILSGYGASYLINKFQFKYSKFVLVATTFLLLLIPIIKTHPNQNAYFNFLIGGLNGAKKADLPWWGNTFGAGYRPAFNWINKNAEQNASLVFVYELMPNSPSIWVRPDINFHNSQRSGFVRRGEYALTLTYDNTDKRSYYDSYLEKFIKPVYSSTVDGVAVVKVWKNDTAHAYEEAKTQSQIQNAKWSKYHGVIEVDLGAPRNLSYLDLTIYSTPNCKPVTSGNVQISDDNLNWKTFSEVLPTGHISIYGELPSKEKFVYSFLAEQARFVRINYQPTDACLANFTNPLIYELPNYTRSSK